jgi:DNA-binding transcriptional ArsR family regulator
MERPETMKKPRSQPVRKRPAGREAPRPPAPEAGSRWTFLTNHSHVLILLSHEPDLVLREVAHRVGITERAVQRIIADLEEAGFLERERVGRQNRYRILPDQALRHPIEAHRTIGDLVGLIYRR